MGSVDRCEIHLEIKRTFFFTCVESILLQFTWLVKNILEGLCIHQFDLLLDKTIKLWKVTERDKRPEGYNLKDESGLMRDPTNVTSLRVPSFKPMELMVEASPRRIFANAHTYHINSISVNSDQETYLSADDLRINLWHLEVTDQSFSILLLHKSFLLMY